MYKLVVLDIDGTTLNSKGKLDKETKIAIHRCLNKNIPVCLCTGRNIFHTRPVLRNLNLYTNTICSDGAIMYDPIKNKTITEKLIHQDSLQNIVSEINKEHLYIEFCSSHKYHKFIKSPDLGVYNYGGSPETPVKKIISVLQNNAKYLKNLDSYMKTNPKVNALLFAGQPAEVSKVKNIIASQNHEGIQIRDDLWENYVFVVANNTNKSTGIDQLCQFYNVDKKEVMAIGDQLNDIDMIKEAGLGIAMGNAHQRIKEIAGYTTLSCDENGVGHAIEKFILN